LPTDFAARENLGVHIHIDGTPASEIVQFREGDEAAVANVATSLNASVSEEGEFVEGATDGFRSPLVKVYRRDRACQ
jgi:hypothetical protein